MHLGGLLKQYGNELLDLVYPGLCFGCKRHILPEQDGFICGECIKKIYKVSPPFCAICGRPIDYLDTDRCSECLGKKYYFSKGYTAVLFSGLIRDCIHSFKYNSQEYLGRTLAEIMADFADKYIDMKKFDLIVPVPLHWKRLRDRGFNQAEILGAYLSRKFNIPLLKSSLMRTRAVQPQVELNRDERVNNMKGAFKVTKAKDLCKKSILLIDDVFTTGATMNECSRVLLESGAKDVWIFTLARGV